MAWARKMPDAGREVLIVPWRGAVGVDIGMCTWCQWGDWGLSCLGRPKKKKTRTLV